LRTKALRSFRSAASLAILIGDAISITRFVRRAGVGCSLLLELPEIIFNQLYAFLSPAGAVMVTAFGWE
jgi:hypothetical protein